ENLVSVILATTLCATIFVTQGEAQLQKPLTIPGFFAPGSPVDLIKCWASLFNVEGCVLEISKSIFSGKFENVEAACCKAFSTLYDANCWPHMHVSTESILSTSFQGQLCWRHS
ncbi:hypothetical protein F2Q69_00025376, partial [Brassica cretica]